MILRVRGKKRDKKVEKPKKIDRKKIIVVKIIENTKRYIPKDNDLDYLEYLDSG